MVSFNNLLSILQKMTETISPAHRHKSESGSDSGTPNIHCFLVLVPHNLSQVISGHYSYLFTMNSSFGCPLR